MAFHPSKTDKLPIEGEAVPNCPATPKTAPAGLPASGYLTADWIRHHYSISNSTLYKWIANKHFPRPVHIGPRAVRWRAEDLAAFEASVQAGE